MVGPPSRLRSSIHRKELLVITGRSFFPTAGTSFSACWSSRLRRSRARGGRGFSSGRSMALCRTRCRCSLASRYTASGHLVYVNDGTLLAQRFDLDNLRALGEPTAIAEGVRVFKPTGMARFTASQTGALAFETTINYSPGSCGSIATARCSTR